MVKMKAVDQIHVSSVSPNTMAKGTEFEVNDEAVAADLEKRGLATRMGGAAKKAEPAPMNKAEPGAPANKAEAEAVVKPALSAKTAPTKPAATATTTRSPKRGNKRG